MAILTVVTSPFALSRWQSFFQNLDIFFKAFLYTLGMSIGALLLALILGTIFGAMSTSKRKSFRTIARIYVELYQNTPLLVQLVFVFYGLAIITHGHLMISTFMTAVLCVGIYHGAYIAEVIRSGIESVPRGQIEAALSQGFTYEQTMSLIVLPQALRTILPPMTNQVVNLIKNTSIVAIISGADIMFTAKAWAYDTTNYVPAFAGAAILYFILCYPLAHWARHKEEENKKTYSV
ncbi:amino acid ABC transporter permease [Streptococcus parauberis]|uniref:Amino acid ABC transporter permease n=3 Tax=Streptococcus parauberis TaxID=1348 RepID=A0A0E2U9F3_9STRE|nr:amino acid ABC transporter permease [Streptococcus parauberis]AEF24802.1 amino acid ABC transporter, permease protein [Streptococcus parauberis KCTC 11537]AUT05569.1 putative amino-acid permease protein YxeN [Streptococcus parauberis]EGE54263.1 ABC transporter, permease protein [Streptococcus parauberis NCFD 2020]EMG26410.1 Glutamate transport permease protein [Streptococcus parauberis KRS-02083]KYP17591.1 putative glutamine ABC transporter permease protein GlnM [Streptococcus parauberis]